MCDLEKKKNMDLKKPNDISPYVTYTQLILESTHVSVY